jgi:hypothetical protein
MLFTEELVMPNFILGVRYANGARPSREIAPKPIPGAMYANKGQSPIVVVKDHRTYNREIFL